MLLDVERAVRERRAKAACDADMCAFCLAMHACITAQAHIPRAWLAYNQGTWDPQINQLLDCRLDELKSATHAVLEKENINIQSVLSLRGQAKSAVLSAVEESLCSILGEGFIHYEHLRVTPFASTDILGRINQYHIQISSKLRNILLTRAAQKTDINKQYGAIFKDSMYHSSMWSRSLRIKIDALWQCSWGQPDAYLSCYKEEAIIESLRLGDGLK